MSMIRRNVFNFYDKVYVSRTAFQKVLKKMQTSSCFAIVSQGLLFRLPKSSKAPGIVLQFCTIVL
jgi:hypothetical protein